MHISTVILKLRVQDHILCNIFMHSLPYHIERASQSWSSCWCTFLAVVMGLGDGWRELRLGRYWTSLTGKLKNDDQRMLSVLG